jgi:hypothetical protein
LNISMLALSVSNFPTTAYLKVIFLELHHSLFRFVFTLPQLLK